MGLLATIILGGIAGWLASIIAGTNARMGAIANVIVGVIGAVVGGMIFNFAGGRGVTGLNLYSLFVSVVGASVVLFVVKKLFR
ncbi:MAG: GlsB/YeaQ/YmgE family stress response membrane protein [Archangiaceae bacterium]|nr:GlsB/YeaQ/YmgE family stress response membrane protein [Archangiaceae bacterium]